MFNLKIEMMKKVTYLLTIMFAVVLMSTSCCKDDPIVPDGPLTEADLQGVWVSESYSLDGTTYVFDACGSLPNGAYMLITLNIGASNTTMTDNCPPDSPISFDDDMWLENNATKLTFGDNIWIKFDVISYDRTEPEILTLLLTDTSHGLEMPLDGTYVLHKN